MTLLAKLTEQADDYDYQAQQARGQGYNRLAGLFALLAERVRRRIDLLYQPEKTLD